MRFAWIGLAVYFATCALSVPGYYGAFAAVCAYLAARPAPPKEDTADGRG